uniref:F-box/kelch-repeat protein At3g23880-like n=1 Tax=Fragaria vesca subsp. vesca TaxID=101020 RepID=UPI0005CA989F|nr:PREDICTED: F-box/kelch-repeat protein At3g23880-like [Fragaria vesca subsp. vesca]XP_011460744.1 PREDICTED: F-box/kelch-repeat protein At3g23880-like [Fragaria vesca subsp. vesca]
MWDDCYERKSLLTPPSASKLCLSISYVITNWLESLPQELIPEILIRLPTKSLIKFTSVCKSWNSTIKDPKFIRTHTLNLNDRNATHLLLLHAVHCQRYWSRTEERVQISGFQEDTYSLLHDDTAVSEYRNIELPLVLDKKLINPCFRVVGTCNGLVLLADDFGEYGHTIVIWNPSVRKYVTLPKFSTRRKYDASLGLGYDAIGNDYKVVRLTDHIDECEPDECRSKAQVYSLAKGAWSMLRPVPDCFLPDEFYGLVFVKGALHWVAAVWTHGEPYPYYFILTFDVAGETFGKIEFPMRLELEDVVDLRLSVSGDRKSIALFVKCLNFEGGDSFLDIWVMKEYSEEKSWTKLVALSPQGPERSLPRAWAFCLKRSGEVILQLDGSPELVSLDVLSKQFKHLGISGGEICSVDSFEESLVLLDRNDAVSY